MSGPTSMPFCAGRRPSGVAKIVRRGDRRLSGVMRVVDDQPAQRRAALPAVPAAAKMMARVASSRSADGREDHRRCCRRARAAIGQAAAATVCATARPMRVEPVAEISGTFSRCRQRLADVCASPMTTARQRIRRRPSGISRDDFLHDVVTRDRGQRRLLRRLPDDRVAADQREHRVPRPDRDREIERVITPDRPQRMPLLHHAMARAARMAIVRP